MAEVSVDRLQIEITANVDYAVKQLDRVVTALKTIETTANRISGTFTGLSNSINRSLGNIQSKTAKATQSMQKLQETVGKIDQSTSGAMPLIDIGDNAQKSVAPVKNLTKNIATLSINIKGLSKHTKKATGTIGKLLGQFKRILTYRAIRNVIGEIGKAFTEGTKNVYAYSQAVGGELAKSLDAISTSFLYLKNSIGAMVSPLINALAPAIELVVDKVVDLINVFNQLFAMLSGSGTWTKAVKKQTTFADATKGASDSVKELTAGFDELNVFNSSSGSGGGSSSSDMSDAFETIALEAGGWIDKIKEALEKADFTDIGKELGQKITDALKKIDWSDIKEVANKIAKSLSTFLNGVISPELFGTLGSTLAEALNTAIEASDTFFTTFDWGNLGDSIATGINDFFATFDGTALGTAIHDFADGILTAIENAVKGIEPELIAQDIKGVLDGLQIPELIAKVAKVTVETAGAIIDLAMEVGKDSPVLSSLIVTVGTIKISNFASALANAIFGLELPKITLPSVILDIKEFVLSGGISEGLIIVASDIIDSIERGIRSLEGGDKFLEIADTILSAIWGGLAGTVTIPVPIVGTVVGVIVGAIGSRIPYADWSEVWDAISEKLFDFHVLEGAVNDFIEDFRKAFNGDNFLEVGENIVKGIFDGLNVALAFVFEPIDNIFQAIFGGLCEIFGIQSPSTVMRDEIGTNIVNGLFEGIKSVWNQIPTYFVTKLAELKTTITTKWDEIKNVTVQKWESIRSNISAKWDSIKANVTTKITTVASTISTKWENVRSNTSTKWESIRSTIATKWDSIKSDSISKVTTLKNTLSTNWENIKTDVTDKWDGIKNAIVTSVKGAVNGAVALLNKFINWVNQHLHVEYDGLEILGEEIIPSFSFQLFRLPTIPTFANGGFVDTGDLFIAREAGAEMVGSIGNRTAVANNDQIVAGISAGVSMANADVVNAIYTLINAVNGKDLSVSISDKTIGMANDRYNSKRGVRVNSGAFANAY